MPAPRQGGYLRVRRPLGQPTRGNTAPNRLRRVDVFTLLYDTPLLMRTGGDYSCAYFVDLGYGASPITTLESAARFRRVHPGLPVLGVEIDPARVEAAQPAAGNGIAFRLGGFNLPLQTWETGPCAGRPETGRLVRAFNVLRQYDEAAVDAAYRQLAQGVLPGGLLIEGTSNPTGSHWVAVATRRTSPGAPTPWHAEALVFGWSLRGGFDPALLQAVLPKRLIHRMATDHPVAAFMDAWKQAAAAGAGYRVWGPRAWWTAAARRLAAAGYAIDTRRRWLNRGLLLWRNPPL